MLLACTLVYYSSSNMLHTESCAVTGGRSIRGYIMTDELSLENRNLGVLACEHPECKYERLKPRAKLSTFIFITAGAL